jgi:hypothetical protein
MRPQKNKLLNKVSVILLSIAMTFATCGGVVWAENADGNTSTPTQTQVEQSTDTTGQTAQDQQSTSTTDTQSAESAAKAAAPSSDQAAAASTDDTQVNQSAYPDRGLPVIDITLHGTTLKTIDSGSKDKKYEGNDFKMTNTDGTQVTASGLEVKGRGNSTWTLPKKPYQIKFSSKTDLLGMGKSKKWVLLANYMDKSYLRNDIALSTAEAMGFNGSKAGKPVELYVNGEYRGLYYLVHKVEIGKATLNLKNNDAILMEIDNLHGADGDPEFYSDIEKTHFVMKEANDEANEKTYVQQFATSYNQLESDIYNGNWDAVSKEIDVASFAKYYLLSEFTANPDASRSSWYMYKDGQNDVIHCGPAWDYDIALGNTDENWNSSNYITTGRLWTYNDKAVSGRSNTPEILTRLMDMPQFRTQVENLYQSQIAGVIQNQINSFDSRAAAVEKGAEADRDKWHAGTALNKKDAQLKNWMIQRKAFMDEIFKGRYTPSNGFYDFKIGGTTFSNCKLVKQSDDSYVITLANGKVLDVTGASVADKTKVQQYDYNGTRAQKWCLYSLSNGQFALMSECNNLFMTEKNGQIVTTAYGASGQQAALTPHKTDISRAKINKHAIGEADVNTDPVFTLDGIQLTKDVDYTLTKEQDNDTIHYTISGIGNYTGSKNFTVKIIGKLIQPEDGYYEIESGTASSKALDINGDSVATGANLQIYDKNHTWAQHFEFVPNSDGTVSIFVEGSREAVDVLGANQANGANVQQYDSNGTDAQRWYVCDNGDGTVTFRSALNTNKVLDVAYGGKSNGSNVQLYENNGTAAQKFKLTREKDVVKVQGTKKILSSLNNKKAVDVFARGTLNGTNIQLWDDNGTPAQTYKFHKHSDGTYRIANTNSGKVLDVACAGQLPGTNIWQWDNNGTNAQRWILIQDGSDVVFRSKGSGNVMDLSWGMTFNGSNIRTWGWNGTGAQKWQITK